MNISVNAIVIEDSIPLTAPKVIGKQSKNKCHSLRKYLEIKDDNVFCLLCQVKYSKNTGISTIKKHFSNFHEEAYKEAVKEAVNVEPYTEKDSKKVELINSQLYEWIICDQQPFNVVENNEFQNLVFILDPRYKLPTRQAVSQYIETIFKEQKKNIYDMLSLLQQKMSITTDAWTACTNQAYLSVTLHWIDKEWCMKHILIDLIPIHENHTGLVLAENILNTLKDYNIGNKILAVTTDNAANMINFGRHLATMLADKFNNKEFMHFRCAAHILNLAVQAGLKLINEPIEKARKFSSKIRNSQPLFEELKKIFAMKGRPFLVPEVDTPTRWNSLYLSIKKLYCIKDMTDILVMSNRQLESIYPTNDDWKTINVSILSIFFYFYFKELYY